jgi:hypothetical protein
MADVVDVILRLKAEGATRIALHPDGSVAQVEFGDSTLPRTQENQDEPRDPRSTYPRRPTGGLVTRAADDSR